MNKHLIIIVTISGILITIFGGLYLFIHIAFDGIFTGPSYDKEDLIENYEERKNEIVEVKRYFESIVPKDAMVHIEFEKDKLGIFHVKRNSIYESNWNVEIEANKTDSLLNILGWTKNELTTLRTKLDKANCISIGSRKPVKIGWQRSGMGILSYNIFDEKLTGSLISEYDNGCSYIFYKENVVLEYGGGAFGP